MRLRTIPGQWLNRLRTAASGRRESWARVRLWAWVVFVTAALAGLLYAGLAPDQLSLDVGDPAPRDIPASFEFVDQPTTDRLRREAAASVPDIYTEDEQSTQIVLDNIEAAFVEVRRIRSMTSTPPEERAALLRERLGLATLTDDAALQVLEADSQTLDMLRGGALEAAGELLDAGIRPDELDQARRRVPDLVRAYEFDRPYEQFVSLLIQSRLQPNHFFDQEATLAARQQAVAAVEPVIIRKGQLLVERGQPVTEDDLVRLRDAGVLREQGPLPAVIGSVLLAALSVGLMGGYLYMFNRLLLRVDSRVVLLGLICLVTILVAQGALSVPGGRYGMPLAAAGMLLAILLEARVAVFATVLLAGLIGLMADADLQVSLVTAASALVGIFSVTRVGQRSDLMRAGLYVGLTGAVVLVIWTLVVTGAPLYDVGLWTNVIWALVGGFLSAVLTIGTLPFLETAFGILTPVRLLELANPNQPLLRRLLLEAPGTYHHSIMVANLCEAAAEQVGADSLLARVGAYYHDVGKMKRPYFFIENQFGGVNPHEKIAPNLSALIITSHVRDGVELAREYGLPEELIKFIREHHGTTTVEYFYNKALEDEHGQGVLEENFRYPGPIPQSKETAICMLADGAEAAVRAMTRPTPGRIEATVRKVIRDRLNGGQLDNCDLTLADLDKIAETFTQVLTGIFHSRIEYPETLEKELEKARRSQAQPARRPAPGGDGAAARGTPPGTGTAGSPGAPGAPGAQAAPKAPPSVEAGG
ncbi:MAG: HDIG domain-containing protein [Thermaerobacter sp.]